MNKLFLSTLIFLSSLFYAQVGINTLTPSPASSLHVHAEVSPGNFRGFMPPRVTVAQRNLIPVTSADDGLMVYTTNADGGRKCVQMYNNVSNSWENIQCFSARIFYETMGSNAPLSTPFPTVTAYHSNGYFDNSATHSFSGINVDVRSTDPYAGGSGLANIWISTSTSNKTFEVTNIDLSSYTGSLILKMAIFKTTNNPCDLTIDYYDSLTSSYVDVSTTFSGNSAWYPVILSSSIPNTITSIRIRKTLANANGYRIDDIEIIKP